MSLFEIISKYREGLLGGLFVSLKLAGIAWLGGLFFGTILGVLSARYSKSVGVVSRILTYCLGSIPVLVLLFWLHYPLQSRLKIVIDPFLTAAMLLTLLNIIAVSEIVRSGLDVFPKEYIDSARVCGLTANTIFFRIQMPLLLRQIIPGLLQAQIVVLHSTLFASLISVKELFRVAQQINSLVYAPIPVYSGLAIFFLGLSLPINILAVRLRRRYGRDLSAR